VTDGLVLASGIRVLTGPFIQLSGEFERAIGTLQASKLSDANLTLLGLAQSTQPTTDDNESRGLRHLVQTVAFALVMQGNPYLTDVLQLSGGHGGNGILVQHLLPRKFVWPACVRPLVISKEHLTAADQAAIGLRIVQSDDGFARFKRGLRSWRLATQEAFAGTRLHLFARSLDALVKTRKNHGRDDFATRIGSLLVDGEEHVDVLSEISNYETATSTFTTGIARSAQSQKPTGSCTRCVVLIKSRR